MKIFIDIGHPAHVHYFKNFIWQIQKDGHQVVITARDKEVALTLLDYYSLPYYNRGKGRQGFFGKLFYIFQADFFLLKVALKEKPDMFLSFGSPYAAHVAWLTRKPHIAFDDTDHNFFEHTLYIPFTKVILTPKVYSKDLGKKHIKFDGFMELCSLHPNQFKPDPQNILKTLGLSENERYVVLRFVSWQASHDMGLKGLSLEDKYELVKKLSSHSKVIISSESGLPADLAQYSFKIHPALMHDVLKGASLLVSESLTMAAEASFLGTPAICISTAQAGTLDEEVKLGLIELYRTSEGLVERALEVAEDKAFKESFKLKSDKIVKDKVDLTALMVWFIENFPDSFAKVKKEPGYQLRFR